MCYTIIKIKAVCIAVRTFFTNFQRSNENADSFIFLWLGRLPYGSRLPFPHPFGDLFKRFFSGFIGKPVKMFKLDSSILFVRVDGNASDGTLTSK